MGLTGNARFTHAVTIRDTFFRSHSGRACGPDGNMVRQRYTHSGYQAAVYLQYLRGSSILTLVTRQQYTYIGY
jgi:hypothetical protein